MERDGPTDLKWADGWNIPVGPNQNGPFLLISNRISGILGWMESAPVKVDYTSSWSVLLTRGLLPYKSYIGMCRPTESRFCAVLVWKRVYTLPILVWNRVWFSKDYRSVWTYLSFQFQMNKKEKKYTNSKCIWIIFLFAHWIEEMMTWFLPNGQVWKRVWVLEVWSENGSVKLNFFGLKWGKDLENHSPPPPPRIPRSTLPRYS